MRRPPILAAQAPADLRAAILERDNTAPRHDLNVAIEAVVRPIGVHTSWLPAALRHWCCSIPHDRNFLLHNDATDRCAFADRS